MTGSRARRRYPALLRRCCARRRIARPARPRPRSSALFGGEAGLDNADFRRALEETWGFEVRNANFGLSEVLSILGCSASETSDLHFHAGDAVFAEIIDPGTLRAAADRGGHDRRAGLHAPRARVPAARALPLPRHGHGHRHRPLRRAAARAWRFRDRRPHRRHVQRARRERLPDRRARRRRRAAGAALRATCASTCAGPGRTTASSCAPRPRPPCRRGAGRRRRRCSRSISRRVIGAGADATIVPYEALGRTDHKTSYVERHP